MSYNTQINKKLEDAKSKTSGMSMVNKVEYYDV